MTNKEIQFISLLEEAKNIFEYNNDQWVYFFQQYLRNMKEVLNGADSKLKMVRLDDYLSQYGGMGSLNDGMTYAEGLQELLNKLYEVAKELKLYYSPSP
jgi:hypothetical protein